MAKRKNPNKNQPHQNQQHLNQQNQTQQNPQDLQNRQENLNLNQRIPETDFETAEELTRKGKRKNPEKG